MSYRSFHSLAMPLAALLIGGSSGLPPGQGKRPADFAVEYHWRGGSLPPPGHYEFTITVGPAGNATVVFVPDYPSMGPSEWTEDFVVGAAVLDDLYRVMVENEFFTRKWRQQDLPPVGGSQETIAVTASARKIVVGAYLVPNQQAPAQSICSAVKRLVPKEIWDRLDVRREQYIRARARR